MQSPPSSPLPPMLPSFGGRQGRKLTPTRQALMETLLPRLIIPASNTPLDPAPLFPGRSGPLWVEIGYGGGEHLAAQAQRHPDVNFIGCEPYPAGIATLLTALAAQERAQVRLYDGDGRHILERLAAASVQRIFILFPDPWPKLRHHKRRIVSRATLALVKRALVPGGLLRLATDHEEYGVSMLETLLAFGGLRWTATSSHAWTQPPEDWVRTRYQAKAEAEGRSALFLEWQKPLETDESLC